MNSDWHGLARQLKVPTVKFGQEAWRDDTFQCWKIRRNSEHRCTAGRAAENSARKHIPLRRSAATSRRRAPLSEARPAAKAEALESAAVIVPTAGNDRLSAAQYP